MAKIQEKAEYIDGNSKVRIVLDPDLGSVTVQNANGRLRTYLSSDIIVIGPKAKGFKPQDGFPLPNSGGADNPDHPSGRKKTQGRLVLLNSRGMPTFMFDGNNAELFIGAQKNAGNVSILNQDGKVSILLNGKSGDIELLGADCAEEFDLERSIATVEPGSVMVIGNEGGIMPCQQAYDRRVAGVVSGAGSYRPGIVLHKVPQKLHRVPLALTGKVFCKVDATFGSVEIGDLLTSSPTPGHAMKAHDLKRTFGAILGKALMPLSDGQDLIPVLVALQ